MNEFKKCSVLNDVKITYSNNTVSIKTGCISCNSDEWYFNRWCWIDNKGDTCHIKIEFCPLCGRKL